MHRSRRSHVSCDVSEKSKSLEGHVSSKGTHHSTDYKHFYPSDADVHSLDKAVKLMKEKITAGEFGFDCYSAHCITVSLQRNLLPRVSLCIL